MVYYSSASGNTHRFVERLNWRAHRIPMSLDAPFPSLSDAFVLLCPTFADGQGRGAVPKPVIRFLNDPTQRAHICGVIGSGNRNFGATYALAGRIISEKCKVPLLYTFELAGTDNDIARVQDGLQKLGDNLCSTVS